MVATGTVATAQDMATEATEDMVATVTVVMVTALATEDMADITAMVAEVTTANPENGVWI